MEGFDPKTSFGDETSRNYDAVSRRGDEEETVAFLAELAGERDALELAVGTGRIALPLRQAGVRVDGIELSQDMVDRLREKPGGDQVQVTIGDMSRSAPDAATGWSTWCSTPSGTCSPRTTRSAASRMPPGT
jgi:SAM-dependent methyltransferase